MPPPWPPRCCRFWPEAEVQAHAHHLHTHTASGTGAPVCWYAIPWRLHAWGTRPPDRPDRGSCPGNVVFNLIWFDSYRCCPLVANNTLQYWNFEPVTDITVHCIMKFNPDKKIFCYNFTHKRRACTEEGDVNVLFKLQFTSKAAEGSEMPQCLFKSEYAAILYPFAVSQSHYGFSFRFGFRTGVLKCADKIVQPVRLEHRLKKRKIWKGSTYTLHHLGSSVSSAQALKPRAALCQ